MERWNNDSYMASWMAACALAGALTMNLVLAIGVLSAFVTLGLNGYGGDVLVGLGIALLFVANYLMFVQNDRYVTVVRAFRNSPAENRRRAARAAWTYLLVSFSAPVIFGVAMLNLGTPATPLWR